MRFDKKGRMHTLEEDIIKTWKFHGLKVISERTDGFVWFIQAERIKKEN